MVYFEKIKVEKINSIKVEKINSRKVRLVGGRMYLAIIFIQKSQKAQHSILLPI